MDLSTWEPEPQAGAAHSTATHSALMAPPLALASCVRAYVSRSTMGASLTAKQRLNHFPASAWCCISWLIHGESDVVRRGDDAISEPCPTIAFRGPHTLPVVSYNPGPVHSFMVVLVPEAIQAMAGIDLAAWANQLVPLQAVCDAAWQDMAIAVQEAPDDAARMQLLNRFLEPRWAALRRGALPPLDRSRYWIESLALQAANSGVGKSLRQAERRIKQWAGLPLRDLRRVARGEDMFYRARAVPAADDPNWAEMAVDGGYADQSHLCRETRRITGLSPNELKKAIDDEEESFWMYRIWE